MGHCSVDVGILLSDVVGTSSWPAPRGRMTDEKSLGQKHPFSVPHYITENSHAFCGWRDNGPCLLAFRKRLTVHAIV